MAAIGASLTFALALFLLIPPPAVQVRVTELTTQMPRFSAGWSSD